MVWPNFVPILPSCRYSSTLALTKQWPSSPPHWHVVPRTSWALPLCSSLSSLPMPSWVTFFLGHKWKTSVPLLNACKLVPCFHNFIKIILTAFHSSHQLPISMSIRHLLYLIIIKPRRLISCSQPSGCDIFMDKRTQKWEKWGLQADVCLSGVYQ